MGAMNPCHSPNQSLSQNPTELVPSARGFAAAVRPASTSAEELSPNATSSLPVPSEA